MKLKYSIFIIMLILLPACSNIQKIKHNNSEEVINHIPNEQPKKSQEYIPKTHEVKMTVVGDLMVHQYQLDYAYHAESDLYNFDPSFAEVKQQLESADFTVGNLETVLGGKEALYSDYPKFNSPDSFAQSLKNVGFDLLTTANNHSNDRNEAGILRTIKVLDDIGIDHVGTYSSQENQNHVYIKEINNISFAFISFSYGTNGIPVPQGKDYLINLISEERIKHEITKAKALNPDVIIALPHMGNEYELIPNNIFKEWTNSMFEAGADIVLASHPHVIQPVEYKQIKDQNGQERNVFVAYSLGNFISSQRTEPRDAGMMLHLYFKKADGQEAELTNVSYSPTWVQFRNKSNQMMIRTLPIYNVLTDEAVGGNKYNLSQNDVNRVKRVHKELSNRILNKNIPFSAIQTEYNIQ